MGFCHELWKHCQRESVKRILTRWKQEPMTTRRAYGERQWQTDDPKNDKPLSEEEGNHYTITLKRHGRPYLYALFPEEDAARVRRQEEHAHWAKEHWPLLAAYAWQQYEHGPGHVYIVPRNLPLALPAPDLIVGQRQLYYEEDERLKNDPEKSVHMIFVCEYPEAGWVFEERLCLALEPPPPVAYKLHPLPAVDRGTVEPVEPHAPPDYRHVETFFLEGLQAQGIVQQWREAPWLPRRAYWLGGTDDDPEGCQPLSDDAVSFYTHMAQVWRWSGCQKNRTEKGVVSPLPVEQKRWARRHWRALAAFAWGRFLKHGPGVVLVKRSPRRFARHWFLDGCHVEYIKSPSKYDPQRSICLAFNLEGEDETCPPWVSWRLTMAPPPPVAYRRKKKDRGSHA
jgi:hypothetical protein